jgi:hypothetical protein
VYLLSIFLYDSCTVDEVVLALGVDPGLESTLLSITGVTPSHCCGYKWLDEKA